MPKPDGSSAIGIAIAAPTDGSRPLPPRCRSEIAPRPAIEAPSRAQRDDPVGHTLARHFRTAVRLPLSLSLEVACLRRFSVPGVVCLVADPPPGLRVVLTLTQRSKGKRVPPTGSPRRLLFWHTPWAAEDR